MDRKLYLDLCQKASMLKSGICGIKENVPDELLVIYDGIMYYPEGYEMKFNNGKYENIAILHDINANSVTRCKLEKVVKFGT